MDRIKYLLLLVLREEASPAEQAELEAWAEENPANRELLQDLQDPAKVAEALATLDSLHRQEAWAKVEAYAAEHRPVVKMEDDRSANRHRTRKLILRWTVAAAFLALLGTGAWWVIRNQNALAPSTVASKPADVPAPTGSRATLTLGSGQQIILDSAASGALVQQGNAQVVKEVGGQLSYRIENVTNHELIYNTLTNPRGSQVASLTLSDGSRVWLNAESSIRYPVVFTGSDRRVEMTGEVYYEVAKNARQPFSVEEKGMTIRVLGTSFNVNGYDDEAYGTTTLVEGKVEVNYGKVGAILEPAMQAQVFRGPNPGNLVPAIKVGPADVARATV